MGIQVDRHLFGSFDGYRTLATSPGVTPDESAELSEFGFGQTSDPSILNSLHERLCVLGRPLRSGRIAITRAFAGPPDDAGRPTLRLCSLVFSDLQFLEVRQGLKSLLGDSKIWSVSGFEQGLIAEVRPRRTSPPPGADALHLVDWWMEMNGRRDLVLSLPLEDRSEDAILSAVASVADIDSIMLRWGIFLFSTSAAADVCTLAPLASRSMRRKVHELTLDVPWRHPQLEAWHHRGGKAKILPTFHDLEIGNLEIEPSEERSSAPFFRTESSGAESSAKKPIALVAASVVILLLGSIAAMTFLSAPEAEPVSTVAENRPSVDPRGEVDAVENDVSELVLAEPSGQVGTEPSEASPEKKELESGKTQSDPQGGVPVGPPIQGGGPPKTGTSSYDGYQGLREEEVSEEVLAELEAEQAQRDLDRRLSQQKKDEWEALKDQVANGLQDITKLTQKLNQSKSGKLEEMPVLGKGSQNQKESQDNFNINHRRWWTKLEKEIPDRRSKLEEIKSEWIAFIDNMFPKKKLKRVLPEEMLDFPFGGSPQIWKWMETICIDLGFENSRFSSTSVNDEIVGSSSLDSKELRQVSEYLGELGSLVKKSAWFSSSLVEAIEQYNKVRKSHENWVPDGIDTPLRSHGNSIGWQESDCFEDERSSFLEFPNLDWSGFTKTQSAFLERWSKILSKAANEIEKNPPEQLEPPSEGSSETPKGQEPSS